MFVLSPVTEYELKTSMDYQNSTCDEEVGLLHNYNEIYQTEHGVVEQCSICGDKQLFTHGIPNAVYLSYHIRSALQPYDVLFSINYPNFDHSLLYAN